MVVQYAVINYDDRPNDDNEVEIKHITDNFEYANKLAFHYAKKMLTVKDRYYSKSECRIVKNYKNFNSICMSGTIVDYRICEVTYNDEIHEYEFDNAWFNVWAVIEINNDTESEKVEDIDKELIYEY